MSVITRLLSFGVTKGLAALLVLTLSVIGGVRTGFDRPTFSSDEERPALVCHNSANDCSAVQAQGLFSAQPPAYKSLINNGLLINNWSHDHLLAPSHLCGSAGGPRAPTSIV